MGKKKYDDDRPRFQDKPWERGPMKCFNCNAEGHAARDCPEPRRPREDRQQSFDNQGPYGGTKKKGTFNFKPKTRFDADDY